MWNTPTALAMTLAPLKEILPRYDLDFAALAWRAEIDLDQDEIARALHQSASTLQRRLRRKGTTYQRLVDTTRRVG